MGWISISGRYLGIVTCSALLLISATLAQTGQASPSRAVSVPAQQIEQSHSPEPTPQAVTGTTKTDPDDRADSDGPEVSDAGASEPSTLATPDTADPGDDNLGNTPSLQPQAGAPQAGSGFYVPQDDMFRFNKAQPVRMAPVRIQIPAAWVDARIRTVGVTPDGQMEAPTDFWEVGWYRYGARPGDPGKSVMAGHLDSQTGAAVFYEIGALQPGDEIRILLGGPDGERIYHVREVAMYHVDDAPLDRIFGPSDSSELILITCGGEWRGNDAGGYAERIVVYAEMVTPGELAQGDSTQS
jgi:hypothetical protein